MAPQLEPIRLNAVCPGIADTPMIDGNSARASPPPGSRWSRRTTSPRRCGARSPAAARGSAGSCSRAATRRRSASRTPRPARRRRARRRASGQGQFRPGSYGMFSISENAPPLRCSTVRQARRDRPRMRPRSRPRRRSTSPPPVRPRVGRCPSPSNRREADALDREVARLDVGGHEPDPADDRHCRLADVLELGEHHERVGLHGAADEHRIVCAGEPVEHRHGLDRGDVGRTAEDEPERAVLVVVRDQDHRLAEVRVDSDGDETISFPWRDPPQEKCHPSPEANAFRIRLRRPAVDLVRAVVDAARARVHRHPRERRLVGEAARAVHLDRAVDTSCRTRAA